MDIFSPSDISSKLKGVSPRQITDLAEKGIIIPVRETPGQGSMRLYDKKNIREIMIALSLRGFIAGDMLKHILLTVKEFKMDYDFAIINAMTSGNMYYMEFCSYKDISSEIIRRGRLASIPTENPKDFISLIVDMHAIDEFIAKNF